MVKELFFLALNLNSAVTWQKTVQISIKLAPPLPLFTKPESILH
jgi:hypothetical protein